MNRAEPIQTARMGAYVGRPMPRLEDLRFVRGQGRYTDDFHLPGQLHAAFVRSPHPHALIGGVDAAVALAMPGVVAVLSGADYAADGCRGIRQVPVPADAIHHDRKAFVATPGRPILDRLQPPLATGKARYLGEPVAVVIADSAAAARDAAEAVEVDYEPLPAVTDVTAALAPGAPILWDEAPGNLAMEAEFGEETAARAGMEAAAIIVEQQFRNQRIANAQMEPRSVLGSYDAEADSYLMIAGSQGAVRQRDWLADCLDVPAEKVRVVCPDVGGGFGPRTNLYSEQAVVVWAAKRIGRPVRWTSDRSESFLTDFQGRDSLATARLALDGDGRILALSAEILANVGAHTVSYVPLHNGVRVLTTIYDVPAAHARLRAVMTNTVPTAPYRGAGRPESHLVIERLLDIAARRLGLDRVEIRRRNLIARRELPYRNPMGLTYDSGDFQANMDQALALADWAEFPARREEARRRGRLAGIGLANYVESPVGAPHERLQIAVKPEGVVEIVAGTQSTGQGHETSFAQVAADRLGVRPQDIRFVTGDTARVSSGGGTHSDRSMRLGGTLLVEASGKVIDQARAGAAGLLGAEPSAVRFADGLFSVPGSNRQLTLFELARAMGADGTGELASEANFTGRIPAYPTGAAVCEVEIDPETGQVAITRYSSVDDAGQPINPLILHGQVHGGIAQGAGQALCEQVVYEVDGGQLVTGSFMDYAMPRADALPSFDVEMTEDPTAGNPLRIKGGGESGITPSLASVMNAVADALSELGIEHLEMPATPDRVWRAIADARAREQTP